MKHQIILYWFGDNEPAYAKWNVENFKKMNPDWEVCFTDLFSYVENAYSKDSHIKVADIIRYNSKLHKMTQQQKDALRCKAFLIENSSCACICCSIDCFPIAPIDSFLLPAEFCRGNTIIYSEYIASNILHACYSMIQVQKNIDLHKPIIKYNNMYINEDCINRLNKRIANFKACNLEFGSSFCCNSLSPVEHLGKII